MGLSLSSSSCTPEATMPRRHTGEGADLSPPLAWEGAPRETRAYALICDDPDAPGGLWVHWVIYDIPAHVGALPEGIRRVPLLEIGAKQGLNSWHDIGFRGPLPPPGHGRHRYYFQLFALSEKTGLEPGASREQLVQAMQGKVLGKAQLMVTYER